MSHYQIIYRHGGYVRLRAATCISREAVELREQALLAGLMPDEIAAVAALGARRTFEAGYCAVRRIWRITASPR